MDNSQKKIKRRDLYKEPILAIMDNIVFTKKSVWAYYMLADKPYDFLSPFGQIDLARQTMAALSAIVRKNDTPVETHLLVTNEIFDSLSWEKQMKRMNERWIRDYNRPFEEFVERQAESLAIADYRRRITFFGIKLYERGSINLAINPLDVGIKKAWEIFKNSISSVFSLPNEHISQAEEIRARESEEVYYQILSNGALEARRPTSSEILLAVKRRLYPSMPAPYLEEDHENRIGMSSIIIEEGGTIEVRPSFLRMEQMIDGQTFEGYRATLSIASFPDNFEIPHNGVFPPFFSRQSVLPYDVFARIMFLPVEKMRGELNKQKLQAEDEIANLASSGQAVTSSLRNTVEDITALEDELVDNPEIPWTLGSYHITVNAPTEELLRKHCTELRQEFAEDDCILAWTSGDQLQLLEQEQIGGSFLVKDFQHTMSLSVLPASGFNHNSYVGDPITQEMTTYKRNIMEQN